MPALLLLLLLIQDAHGAEMCWDPVFPDPRCQVGCGDSGARGRCCGQYLADLP